MAQKFTSKTKQKLREESLKNASEIIPITEGDLVQYRNEKGLFSFYKATKVINARGIYAVTVTKIDSYGYLGELSFNTGMDKISRYWLQPGFKVEYQGTRATVLKVYMDSDGDYLAEIQRDDGGILLHWANEMMEYKILNE